MIHTYHKSLTSKLKSIPVSQERKPAFTLLEILVTSGLLTLLLAMLVPALSSARAHVKATACRSNIRQLLQANDYYADDNNGLFAPGAEDFLTNLSRWHGKRNQPGQPFQPSLGPLAPYLGPDGQIKKCPAFDSQEIGNQNGGFEMGNGGYGYNNAYVGVESVQKEGLAFVTNDRTGVRKSRISRPGDTIMFTDAAFVSGGLIEYSFAEPRFHPQYNTYRAVPSIHFRHAKLTNVGWCDGHADAHGLTHSRTSDLYQGNPEKFNIGWFGHADDNSLFDLQ